MTKLKAEFDRQAASVFDIREMEAVDPAPSGRIMATDFTPEVNMNQPELTHYESVLQAYMPYEKEARAFAQRAFAKGEPEKAFHNYMLQARSETQASKSKEEALSKLLDVGHKAGAITHYLTLEILRRGATQGLWPLATDETFASILRDACLTPELAITNTAGHMHYHMALHRACGRKVFDVSPALAEKLLHTELRGLTADDLKLPYPAVYIAVPKNTGLQIWNEESGWHRVIGLYLSEDTNHRSQRCWRFLICGEPKPREVVPGVVDSNDALVYFYVALPAGLPLSETIALAHEEANRDTEAQVKHHYPSGFEKMLDKWEGIFRWAMNVVLYTSWEGAEKEEVTANETAKRILEEMSKLPKDSKKRHRLSDRLSQMHQLRRIFLGRSMTTHAGWELTVRVLVTGHWRNQPYGAGSLLRKLIWIEPYWKGKEPDSAATPTASETIPVAP